MEELTTPPDSLPAAEVEMLADNMAATYAARLAYYRDKWGLDAEAAKIQAFATPEKAQHIMTKPSSVIGRCETAGGQMRGDGCVFH